MPNEPVSLAARRWDAGDGDPRSHSVKDMLQAIIGKIDAGELEIDHAVFVWGKDAGNIGDDGYFQSGSFGPYAQIGLLHRGIELMKEGN